MKCESCNKKIQNIMGIKNYVVRYESWEAFNCCCKKCAKQAAINDGIEEDEITSIE